jgi:hypothetical protein
MLGLGLALSVAKGVIDEIGGLLSKLARRSTYSENLADSRAVVSDIDSYDLLDKASILLTPTATSDARVHSVKTYTGENFLTGNNSTFDSGIGDWGAYSGASIAHSTDKLEVTLTSSEGGANIDTNALISGGQTGKTLKVRARIWKGTSTHSTIAIYIGGVQKFVTISSTPTYFEAFLKPTNTANLTIYRAGTGSTGTYFIDDVSVIDVSSDFDFDRASSATRINSSGLVQDMQSITDPELVLNGDFEELGDELVTNGTFDTDSDWNFLDDSWKIIDGKLILTDTSTTNVNQAIGLVQNKFYKIVFTIANTTLGGVRVRLGTGAITSEFTNGTHTIYLEQTTTNDAFRFYASTSGVFNGSIDNVSVQQVDYNDRWSLGTGWSIEDGKLKSNGTINVTAFQENVFSQSGNTYKIKFDVNVASGSLSTRVRMGDSVNGHTTISNITSEGSYTLYATAVANQDNLNFTTLSDNTAVYTIDNVSVKDITFSTDVDLARISYDSNGENGHILLEPTSTNLVTYSEDFSGWTTTGTANVTPNTSISPDGTQTASTLNIAPSTFFYKTISTGSGTFTLSCYVKVSSGTNDFKMQSFNGTDGADTSSVFTATTEWQRFEHTVTVSVDSNFYPVFISSPLTGGDFQIWGAQVEALSYATSYIPTLTGSTVTRATETLTGSGNSTLINSTEGVLYAEIAALVDDLSFRTISISDGTTSNRCVLRYGGTTNYINVLIFSGGSTVFDNNYTLSDITDFSKIAVKWKVNDFALWVDGVERKTDTSGSAPIGLSELQLSNYDSSSNNFYGKCKALAVFNEALSDDELELLTGVTNYGSFGELASANGYTII